MPRQIEGEPVETKTPHCPTCERPFNGIYDYPQIVITDLVVSSIPNFIRNMPEANNISGKIKRFSKLPEVKEYLKRLSSSKNKPLNIRDVKPDLPEFQDKESKGYYKLGGLFCLHLTDSDKPDVARVSVFSHIHPRGEWGFLEIAKLAEIKYRGVLHEPGWVLQGVGLG